MKGKIAILSALALLLPTLSLAGCHQHIWSEATCTEPKTCSCGETEGEPLGHTMTPATCTKPATCSVCGATEGAALGHTWADATCTEPKTCTACGETEGEALGHTWADATYDTPMTCTVCGETEGEPLPCPYAIEHNFTFDARKEFTSPAFAYINHQAGDPDLTSEMAGLGFTPIMDDASYTIGDITVSEPDADGNVQVVIPCTIDCRPRVHYDVAKPGGSFHTGWQYRTPGVFDYYTGYTIPIESGDINEERPLSTTDFTFDGKTTSVSLQYKNELLENTSGNWKTLDDGSREIAFHEQTLHIMTVTMPQDYDGLCLIMDASPWTDGLIDTEEENADLKSEPLLESLEDPIDQYILLRVSDLIG